MLITISDTGPSHAERRIRLVSLFRPPGGSFGFHLRGGREHSTGFFISHVEPGTEAHLQGLQTGDQVLTVNHMSVNRALHREVTSLIQGATEISLEVKGTGLIPVKNNPSDPLSWVLVEKDFKGNHQSSSFDTHDPLKFGPGSLCNEGPLGVSNEGPLGVSNEGPLGVSNEAFGSPVQIVISGVGKYTIGCSICKGPPEKPGIFVQRVREGGIADDSGLRPGDQILRCNGLSFCSIDFEEAIQTMKSSSCLRLEVLRGAGLDLVMGESSGYNSSASSETGGDRSPSEQEYSSHGVSLASTLSRRLRERVHLDPSRDWGEIDAEWADAEASQKQYRKIVKHVMPKEKVASSTARSRPSINKHQSMIDLRPDGSINAKYKIALQMSDDVHVSKIVIPPAPKDEQNAVLRLEQLSSSVKGYSTMTHTLPSRNHSKTYSVSSTSSEEFPAVPLEHSETLNLSLKDKSSNHLSLTRCWSVPQDNHAFSSEDSDSLLSFPSSTISLSGNGSGRFTSKILIKNNPPLPPPRHDNTKLSRLNHRKFTKAGINHRNQPKAIPVPIRSACLDRSLHSTHFNRNIHPPTASTMCGHRILRTTSFGSLSNGSSDESSGAWEDSNLARNDHIPLARVAIPNPSQRLQNIVNSTYQPVASPARGVTYRNALSSSVSSPALKPPSAPSSSIPPAPPPPPPCNPVPSLVLEPQEILSRQQEICGAAGKLRSVKDRPDDGSGAKPVPVDPKKMQHERLMEEFKMAHAKMVSKRQNSQQELDYFK